MSHVLSQIQISPATPVSTIEHGPSPSAHVELLYILFNKIYANLNDILKLFKSSPEKRVINFVCLCKLYRIWALVFIKKIVCVVPSLFPRRFWFPMLIWVYKRLQKYRIKKSKRFFINYIIEALTEIEKSPLFSCRETYGNQRVTAEKVDWRLCNFSKI